jgi:ubiquitin-protein ligase
MKADNTPVPDARQSKIMMAQYKKAVAEKNEFVKFYCTENPCVWYIKLGHFSGDNGEYVGGEYLCRMVAPIDFPFNPPSFYFMTPNGLYEIETKVCISIGEYHKDQYRAALGMAGFANQLVSGLIGWKDMGGGINILQTTAAQKERLAEKSVEYNTETYSDINDKINSAYAEYSKKWAAK